MMIAEANVNAGMPEAHHPCLVHDDAISSQVTIEAMSESVRSPLDFDELRLHTTVSTHPSAFTSQLNK